MNIQGILLPFHQLSDNEFDLVVHEFQFNQVNHRNDFNAAHLNNILFNQFNSYDSHNSQNCPDNNFFNNYNNSVNQCNYLLPGEINNIIEGNFFSCCHFNINSIPKHFQEFEIECVNTNSSFDIIGFTETKLTPDIEHLYEIGNYNRYNNSKNRASGGLALYVSEKYPNQYILNEYTKCLDFIESLFVRVEVGKISIICGVVYHRPGTSTREFVNEINLIMNEIINKSKYVFIMGDFNINLLNADNRYATDLIDMFHSLGLLSLINKPTRVTDGSITLIDHIWSNCFDKVKYNGILYTHISDHFPIFSIFDIEGTLLNSDSRKLLLFRDFSDLNIENFKQDLDQTSWDLVFATIDANIAYENFFLIFKNLFDKHFPIIHKSINLNHHNKPYITNELKVLIKEKNRIHKKFIKKPLTFGIQYRNIRNRVNNLVKKNKYKYYQDKLNNSSKNSKDTWRVINDILHRKNPVNTKCSFDINNNCVNDPSKIAQAFNSYYVKVGANLAESINIDSQNNTSFVEYMGDRINSELVFNVINPNDIINIINELKDSSAGCDEIPAFIVKKVANLIADPFSHICNCSLIGGIFPSKLKVAKVIPIYKRDCKNKLKNYRPISLLPCFSKVIEKVISIQLISYLETNDILNDSQFGFRAARSTTAATLNLVDFILEAFDRHEFAIGVFLDLTKAFETVDHSILLHKLNHIGVRGSNLNLMRSYLSERQQYVDYFGSESDLESNKYSVPQGSILGPVLFLIYINDVVNCSNKVKSVLFADDTCLYASHNDLKVLIDIFNRELVSVNNWLKANKLSLNVEKSSYIIFTRRKKIPPDISEIKIENLNLSRCMNTNFLGINITHNLSWNLHLKILNNKINKIRGILYVTKEFLNRSSKLTIYYALVYPNLTYGNIIWGKAPKSKLNNLIISQKKVVRAIAGVTRGEHTNSLFIELGLLKINEINIFITCTFVFKSINGLIRPANYFHENFDHDHNLRRRELLRPPFVSTTQSQSTPKYYGCLMWNSLPQDILSVSSLFTFKRKLKLYLLNSYIT